MKFTYETDAEFCNPTNGHVIGTCPFTEDSECPGSCDFYKHRKAIRDAEREADHFLRETAVMGGYM